MPGRRWVIEWLFAWPGIGRLLAWILIPSQDTHVAEVVYFLSPSALAATLAVFALLFLLIDLLASIAIRIVDPRLRSSEGEA
jgi:ABC-type dipeptide/oligopeptide/nickel transport system permease component